MINYDKMPSMIPMPILTAGKGTLGAVKLWISTTRRWTLADDWYYQLDGIDYMVPKGFVFDGASVPKFFRSWLSPMGILLIPGLIHDFGYKNSHFMTRYGKDSPFEAGPTRTQKYFDEVFRDTAISVNGFKYLNYAAFYSLRLAGFLAWRGHRRND